MCNLSAWQQGTNSCQAGAFGGGSWTAIMGKLTQKLITNNLILLLFLLVLLAIFPIIGDSCVVIFLSVFIII